MVRLGEGAAADLSPDGAWALAIVPSAPSHLMLYPTGPGEPRRLESGNVRDFSSARFFPDGKRILACGTEVGHASRCYVVDVAGSKPRPITAEGTSDGFVSPDGTLVVVEAGRGRYQLYPSAGGEPRPVPSLATDDLVSGWTADGQGLLVRRWSEIPAELDRLDLASGRRTLVQRLAPQDLAGVVRIQNPILSGDGKAYIYSPTLRRADLFLVEGAR